MEKFNGYGDENFVAHSHCVVSVVATGSYYVVIDDEVQPTKRYYNVKKDQAFELLADKKTRWTYTLASVPSRGEINSGEKLVEVIPDGEISMEDRFRAMMMAEVSKLADRQGLDTFEDDNDYDFPEEDDPLSIYEKREMVEEYLAENGTTPAEVLAGNKENTAKAPQETVDVPTSESASVPPEQSNEAPTPSNPA